MTRDKTDVSLREMLDYSREALSFVENVEFQQFESDRMSSLAVVRLVEIVGEAENRIPTDVQSQYPKNPWREIIDMQNVIAHGYDILDYEILWKVLEYDLPRLIQALEKIIPQEN
jgi:uncharacterized protein with HEPN domain